MIADDWRLSQIVLQVLAEQGVGLAYAAAEQQENAKLANLRRKLHG